MNAPMSLRLRLALTLMRRLDQVLPESRRDWATAMRAELAHLANERDALSWAIGCIVAGSKERITTMLAGNLKVSRWILVPEMLLCFVPLTFGWVDAIGGGSGLIRMNRSAIQAYFLHAPDGTIVLAALIAGAALGVLGPTGLAAAFRWVVSGRTPGSPWLRSALVAGPALYGLVLLVARLAIGGTGALAPNAADGFDFWSGILLLSVLPSLGAAHLLRLAPRSPYESLAAT